VRSYEDASAVGKIRRNAVRIFAFDLME